MSFFSITTTSAAISAAALLIVLQACAGHGIPTEEGIASWYGERFHGRKTASGEPFDMKALTAAHPTLPFGTIVRVTNTRNRRTVDVRINDRGPYAKGRIIDLSYAAAKQLEMIDAGAVEVRLEVRSVPDDS